MRKGNLLFPSESLAGKLLPHLKILHYFKETECIGLICVFVSFSLHSSASNSEGNLGIL